MSPLYDVPGLGGYLAAEDRNQARGVQQLQQASTVLGIQDAMRKQGQEQAYRSALAGLGPNPTQEQLAQVAARHGTPSDVLRTQQTSLDRASALEAKKANDLARLEQNGRYAEMMHEWRLSQAKTAEERAAETGRHNKVMEGLQLQVAQLRTDASAEKPPPGYRKTKEGNLEAIPGGPADTKAQGVYNADTATLQNTTSAMDRLAVAANEMKQHPGLSGISGVAGAFPDIPGSNAANARAKLQTLKAQVGFGVLQDMRNAAANKASGLGQITERELAFLQNALAALDTAQSEEQIKDSLDKIIKFTEESKGRLRSAYNMKHADKAEQSQSMEFATEADAAAAAKAGKIKVGDKITVGGKKGTWR